MIKVVSHCLVTLLLLMVVGCGGDAGPDKDAAKDTGKDSNKDGKSNAGAGAGTVKVSPLSTLPDEKRLRAALREDVDQAIVDAIALRYKKMMSSAPPAPADAESFTPKNDVENLKAFMTALAPSFAKPGQTEIQVHAATTEEIIEYKKDSVAYNEFPGGAKRIAPKVLRPGVTFYEVEYLKPGEDAGMKFHLFYWDGNQWSMLGAAWRELPAE